MQEETVYINDIKESVFLRDDKVTLCPKDMYYSFLASDFTAEEFLQILKRDSRNDRVAKLVKELYKIKE